MSTHAVGSSTSRASASDPNRRFVQVIDLYTREPAELERLLNRWRATSLAREHISEVGVARADDEDGHVVLEVEYEPVPEPTTSPEARVDSTLLADVASPEAGAVVALLDRPPRFRPSSD